MRVLLVTNDYPPKPGGIQQYLANIVAHTSADVRVLGPADPDAGDDDVRRGSSKWMLPTPGVRRWIEGHVADFKPDVIVFGAPYPLAQLGPSLRRRTALPYVVLSHGAEVTIPSVIPGARQFVKRGIRNADHVFAVSGYTEQRVRRLGTSSTSVLGAGVDIHAFAPRVTDRRDRPIVLGCVSRFIPRKGHDRVIDAAELLADSGVDVEVVIAGAGRLERRLRRQAAAARVPVNVTVGVPWEDLPDLYRSFDIFAMPARSRWLGLEIEGLGIVYLEAAATGLPMVVGRSGGAPETVVPGETGFIAESVDEIVEAVTAILASPALGAANRQRAEAVFTWDAVAGRFDEVLRQLAS